MTDKKVWLVTGAGRGMGVDIAKAALAAGDAVVATGRNPDTVTAALGQDEDLLAVKLDVTDPADAQAAVQAAVERFGRIDVLVTAVHVRLGGPAEVGAGRGRCRPPPPPGASPRSRCG
jgi:NAD(P)-dependent dehydrogenase (short-subunit alcohol dehydrogenase family)